jgi:hypothetical protein
MVFVRRSHNDTIGGLNEKRDLLWNPMGNYFYHDFNELRSDTHLSFYYIVYVRLLMFIACLFRCICWKWDGHFRLGRTMEHYEKSNFCSFLYI